MKAAIPPRRRRGNGQHPPPVPAPVPPALSAPPQPATLMQAIIAASADPAVDVGKIGELVKLHSELQARDWEQKFNRGDGGVPGRA